MLNDIISLDGDDNIGGLELLEFALANDISSIPDAINMLVTTAIVMKSGKRFYECPFTLESAGFSETASDTPNGALYNKTVKVFVPCDNNANAHIFDQMENGRFIVVTKDNNGRQRIVGTVEQPLQVKIERNTQQAHGDTPGVTLTFYGEGTHQSYFYSI